MNNTTSLYAIYLKLTHLFRLKEKWHQFDGVSYIYGGFWGKVKDQLLSSKTVENRTTALRTFMPKWKGFLVGDDDVGEEMTATDALVELDKVVSCMTNVWVKESDFHPPVCKTPPEFNIKTVSACKYNCIVKQQYDYKKPRPLHIIAHNEYFRCK